MATVTISPLPRATAPAGAVTTTSLSKVALTALHLLAAAIIVPMLARHAS
jgi:hypothetical protein